MRTALLSVLAASALFGATTAVAQGIEHRENRQQDRIERGAATGELTPHETNRLEHREARLVNTEDRMRDRNGGYLTHHQRNRLHHMADRNSHVIHKLRNNSHDSY